MTLKEKLKNDVVKAVKDADSERVGVLRLLQASLHNEEIEKRGKGNSDPLSDDEIVEVLKREAKKRKESIEVYAKAGRSDLREKEEKELSVIKEYLPEEVSPDTVKEVVGKVIASGLTDFGAVMKETMKELKGRADGKTVSEIVKSLL